jgi:S1-C subfamily serine protease
VAVDGKRVTGADDVVSAIAAKKVGDTVELEYHRGDDKRTVEVKLTERPEQLESATQP